MAEPFPKLMAVYYDTLEEAQEDGLFTWVSPGFCNPELKTQIGSVFRVSISEDGSESHSGIPGSVEVPARWARLFVAAPDLLAACKKALAQMERAYKIRVGLVGIEGGQLARDLDAMRAAIAKAESGETA